MTRIKGPPKLVRVRNRRNWYIQWTNQASRSQVVSTHTTSERKAREVLRDFSYTLQNYGRAPKQTNRRFLYAFQQGTDGPVKFGVTQNMTMRRKRLQEGNPIELKVLSHCQAGGEFTEALVFNKLRGSRIRGEWFWPTKETMAVVDEVKKAPNPGI